MTDPAQWDPQQSTKMLHAMFTREYTSYTNALKNINNLPNGDFRSSDCSGGVAGTFSAPGISDTGSLGSKFGSVSCTIPDSSGSATTTSSAVSEPTDVCDA